MNRPAEPGPSPSWLRALGNGELPETVKISSCTYRRLKTFKHDYFAATGLYEGEKGRIVVKIGRRVGLVGPLIGRLLARRELRLYKLTEGLAGVPKLIGPVGPTGFAHEYIEGRPLQKGDRPEDAFFPALEELLLSLHARGIAYVDLEKRENVLMGQDGRPYLFDFQISYVGPAGGWHYRPGNVLLRILQKSDHYHLAKHWRRLRPDQLPEQYRHANRPPWITWHRRIFRPITVIRRHVLVWLGGRDRSTGRSPG